MRSMSVAPMVLFVSLLCAVVVQGANSRQEIAKDKSRWAGYAKGAELKERFHVIDLDGCPVTNAIVEVVFGGVEAWNAGNFPDEESDGAQFVFVHGYNVNEASARAWGAEMFKRLWQSGSCNMFTAVTWYGNDSQSALYLGNTPDYYSNVEHALSTAAAFKQSVQALPGTAKYIAAHSLGNMLVSSAIAEHGLAVARYFMLNAAVPIEAYAPSAITETTRTNMTPVDWRPYALRPLMHGSIRFLMT